MDAETSHSPKPRSPRPPSRRDKLELAAARTLESGLALLPERAAHRVGAALGRLASRPLGIRREIVAANLRTAFPDATAAWIDRTAHASYVHNGREAAAMLGLSRLDRQGVIDRTVTHGWDELQAALGEGKGVILATGHYGNWEVAAATVAARGVPIGAIVRRQRNRLFDAHLNEMRARLGIETIYMRDAPLRVPRLLRRNGVVGIVGDQDAGSSGIQVPFFGRPVWAHRGPALFALRFGAALFSCVARRRPGPDTIYDVIGERLAVHSSGDLEADLRRLTAELAARLEAQIRVAPEQYFWFHRRWRNRRAGPPSAAAEQTRLAG